MLNIFLIFITAITVSMYYFPFAFRFMPTMVGKTIMAAIGLALILVQWARKHQAGFDKEMYMLVIGGSLVSLVSIISAIVNHTPDYSYAIYFISMAVWMSAAYLACFIIKQVHGYLSVRLVCNYLIAVCTGQCILALLIEFVPVVRSFVTFIEGPHDWLEEVNRLYGLGAALDTAGVRFSAVLVMIAFVVSKLDDTIKKNYMGYYIGAFVIISVVGNMIARTTTVGVIVALSYLVFTSGFYKLHIAPAQRKIWLWMGFFVFMAVLALVYFYNVNPAIHKYTRFAFEGFFSLFEKGEWEVGSNNILKNMIVFPETFKTWIIGDGYIVNPLSIDPYFTGKMTRGYYMGTDIGYLRFLFYFGLAGLIAFSAVIYKAFRICYNRFTNQRALFVMLLLINFIVWFKVSTDIFMVFALFLMVDKEENAAYEKRISNDAATSS